MFAKLMKHEWRATAGTQGALCAAILSLGVLGMANLSAMIRRSEELNDLAAASLSMSIMFIYLALVICMAASAILLMVRFYKSRFTDQGYLTFTLPVNVHQNFLSVLLNSMIWSILISLSAVIAFALMGLATYNALDPELIADVGAQMDLMMGDEFREMWIAVKSLIPAYAVQLLVSFIYSLVVAMTCLTVGATLAKKHKILMAIGVYYLISMATSMLHNSLTISITEKMVDILDGTMISQSQIFAETLQDLLLASLPLQIVVILACYILSTQMMKRKLNLN